MVVLSYSCLENQSFFSTLMSYCLPPGLLSLSEDGNNALWNLGVPYETLAELQGIKIVKLLLLFQFQTAIVIIGSILSSRQISGMSRKLLDIIHGPQYTQDLPSRTSSEDFPLVLKYQTSRIQVISGSVLICFKYKIHVCPYIK